MTREEALTLKKGDKIGGTWSDEPNTKIIEQVRVNGSYLEWCEPGEPPLTKSSCTHSWSIHNVKLVERAEPVVADTYPIF